MKDCQSKEACILWSHHEETGSCLKKDIKQGTMSGARRRGRPRTAWMDNIKMWTGLITEQSEWHRTEIKGEITFMVWPTLGSDC